MLEIEINLIPHGDKDKKDLQGLIVIANDGTGSLTHGNYTALFSHTKKYHGTRPEPYKIAKIRNFNRKQSVYELLKLALNAMTDPPKKGP